MFLSAAIIRQYPTILYADNLKNMNIHQYDKKDIVWCINLNILL